jgi:hypothetical protein
LLLEARHACDVISVVAGFMVDVAGLKPDMCAAQYDASRVLLSLTVSPACVRPNIMPLGRHLFLTVVAANYVTLLKAPPLPLSNSTDQLPSTAATGAKPASTSASAPLAPGLPRAAVPLHVPRAFSDSGEEVPRPFLCPITCDVFVDPVYTADGTCCAVVCCGVV